MNTTANAERYAAGLNALGTGYVFEVFDGRTYDKVVQTYEGSNLHVHAFVNRATGTVHKPEGWTKPVKTPRFATVEDALKAAKAVGTAAGFGGYLYRKPGVAS